MPPFYKSKSRGLQKLALGETGRSFKKFGRATERVVSKAGERAGKKKKQKQRMGSVLGGLLAMALAPITGGGSLIAAGATGIGSYLGGRAGAKAGEDILSRELGGMGVEPAREAGEDISGALYEGLAQDAFTDALMAYTGGELSKKGMKGILPEQTTGVHPTTGMPVSTKTGGIPFLSKHLPAQGTPGAQRFMDIEKLFTTPGKFNPFAKAGAPSAFDFSQLTKGGGVGGTSVPTMFGEFGKQSLPFLLPQLMRMYEGR